MITVKYTLEELQALTKLLDLAVKTGGLQIAGDAFIIHQKHVASLQAFEQERNVPPGKPQENNVLEFTPPQD